MAPRGLTLPPASTSSAKAFRSAFYCDLCSKGYSRQNEFDAHESSYDHQHKKRLKEMKSMQKQAQQPTKGREEKGPLMQIKLGPGKAIAGVSGGDGGVVRMSGFKKGGFKSAFASTDDEPPEVKEDDDQMEEKKRNIERGDSDFTDEESSYDPREPTGCMPGCKSRVRAVVE